MAQFLHIQPKVVGGHYATILDSLYIVVPYNTAHNTLDSNEQLRSK